MTVRLSDSPSAPQDNHCEISHFLASLGACNLILKIHVVVNWQLSKQSIRWPTSHDYIMGSGVDPFEAACFLESSADKLVVFNWSQAQLQEDFFAMLTSLIY